MPKTQARKIQSRSAMAPRGTKLASRASTRGTKVAAVKKSSSVPTRSLDRLVKHRAGSKQARVIEMLMKPEGTTIGEIMRITDWQQHSVRGFFAGIIRKKLKLTLTSQATKAGRIYKIAGNAASVASTGSKSGKAAA